MNGDAKVAEYLVHKGANIRLLYTSQSDGSSNEPQKKPPFGNFENDFESRYSWVKRICGLGQVDFVKQADFLYISFRYFV